MPFDNDPNQEFVAYSTMEVKAVTVGGVRKITGMASTPTPDRVNDIMEPMGAEYKLPLPLLHHHSHGKPVGWVTKAKRTRKGIEFEAEFADIEEEGSLKDDVERAYQEVKAGLIRAVSIGYRTKEFSILDDGGWRITSWEWYELSLVTIPANADCTIDNIKSFDRKSRGAAAKQRSKTVVYDEARGRAPSNPIVKYGDADMSTNAKAIEKLRAAREKKVSAMDAITAKATEDGRTMTDEELDQFNTIKGEIKSIDDTLEALEFNTEAKATSGTVDLKVVDADGEKKKMQGDVEKKPEYGSGHTRPADDRKGIAFAKFVKCMANARGHTHIAADLARKHYSDDARIAKFAEIPAEVKAAVPAAWTGDDAGWAEDIAQANTVSTEFIEFLRPMNVVDQMSQFMRPADFNVQVPRMTTGQTANWKGEGRAAGVTSGVFDTITLGKTSVVGISVITKEQAKFSNINAEVAIRDDLAKAVSQKMDESFLSADAAVANVSPAGILNGLSAISANGSGAAADVRADIQALFAPFSTANISMSQLRLIMTENLKMALMLLREQGLKAFPNVNAQGGEAEGFPVLGSNNAGGGDVVMIDPSSVYLADDGQAEIDITDQASLQLDDAPAGDATVGTGAALTSLWAEGLIGIKVQRYVNWQLARAAGVAYVGDAVWNGAPTA